MGTWMGRNDPAERALVDLGGRIARLRARQGLTRAELAVRAGFATETVARLERGRQNATTRTLLKVADALGVDVRELFGARRGRPR